MTTTEDRFWSKVDKSGDCWLWTGSRSVGYGNLGIDGQTVLAHRYVYELEIGPIPDGLQIDHLCRVRHCVNPDHLETVTQRENIMRSPISVTAINARKTHCPAGHRLRERDSRGWRFCRECTNARWRRNYHRRRAEASA